MFEHNIMRVRDEQLTAARERYLTLLRSTLLDQPYLENEVRIEYLLKRATEGLPVLADLLRAPESHLRKELLRLQRAREAGHTATDDGTTAFFPYTAMGAVKLEHLDAVLHTIRDEGVAGDFVECEPGRGGAAVYMPRVPGGGRDPRPPGVGRESVPVLTRRSARRDRSPKVASTISWPTSPRCARRSTASDCSMNACGSCRATSRRRWQMP